MNTRLRFTSRDLESLPEDGRLYEVIDGELHVSRQPHWHHQYICLQLGVALQAWSRATGAGVANLAPGVIFAEDDDVVPDVVWMSRARRASVVDADGKVRAAPELVVEVLSPGGANEQRDREFKLKLYSRQGVLEYWIVDWRARTVQVFRREQAALQLAATLYSEDALTSPHLPGFACPVADLWEPAL